MNALLTFATALIAVATLAPLLSMRAWWVRDFDFPRLQIACLAGLLIVVEAALKPAGPLAMTRLAILAGCVAYQLWWILPYTRLWRREVLPAGTVSRDCRLRILSANVLMDNRNAAAVVAQVRHWRPDIFVALETDHWWQSQLDTLKDDYPHTLQCPLPNRYGMSLYCRLPLIDPEIQFLLADDVPSMHFMVRLPCRAEVVVHCIHPTPPSPTENPSSSERDAELIVVGRAVAGHRRPVVVAGDLNDVAWSRTTRLFRKISGLLDPRVGRGMFNTFHADYVFFRWPLDHLFHSDEFCLVDMRRLGKTGSDHFPILVELALKAEAAERQEGLEADEEDRARARETLAEEEVAPSEVHQPADDQRH